MKIGKACTEDIESIVRMSVNAFQTDVYAGGREGDFPPDYDSVEWHIQMAEEGHLFKAVSDNRMVGAAVLFPDESNKRLYIGRIFIDSIYHKKGYGIKLMKSIEMYFPYVEEIYLDTPKWNVRTNSFYQKIGYEITKEENGFIYYHKKLSR